MGRPAKFRNGAERQKAYRERKKTQQTAHNLLEGAAVALRNSPAWEIDGAYVTLDHRRQHTKFEVNGRFRFTANALVVQYLLANGELIEIGRNHFNIRYMLNKTPE